MPTRSFVAGVVAVVCFAAGVEAQSMTPLRLGVAVGPSFNRTSWEPWGAHAVMSLTSQRLGSRLGIRVEALFDGAERTIPHDQGRNPLRASERTIGLTINPIYRLWGRRTGLYAIAGIGLYHRWGEGQWVFGDREYMRFSSTELGVNAGLGIDFTLFGRNAFVEWRQHSAAFHDRVPLSLGIRF